MKRMIVASLALLGLMLTGCAQMKMSQPQPTIENVQKAKTTLKAPVAVGEFKAASQVAPAVSIRSNGLSSPMEGAMPAYLRETLLVELKGAQRYDAAAAKTISGELLKSEVNAPVGKGSANLAARFRVTQGQEQVYDKVLGVSAEWDSPFIGVEAIPLAAGQYEALYRKLISQLLDDADFHAQVSAK